VTTGCIPNLEPWARELLESSRVARLGLLDGDGQPRVLPITFALEGECVWSAIDKKPKRSSEPARVRFLREHPRAAISVDRYEDDWERLAWVQLQCDATILEAAAAPTALAALAAKYPQYQDDPPPGPLLRFEPRSATSWRAASGAS
jgi:PPOX class probable F420-dependent enzyme